MIITKFLKRISIMLLIKLNRIKFLFIYILIQSLFVQCNTKTITKKKNVKKHKQRIEEEDI